jgi:hypothetical protein
MKCIVLATIILAAVSDSQDQKPVHWTPNYTDALNQTQETVKPLLVVIDDPSDPERRSEQATTKPDKAQAELLGSYDLCRVDAATEHGKQVADAFGARQLPFMAIIDKTGASVLYQNSGKMDTAEWDERLEAYKGGEIPVAQTAGSTKVASKQVSTSRSRRSTVQSTCYT